jgi:hypothetical protein
VSRAHFGPLLRVSVSLIVAMQHTSFDVYAYAKSRIKIPINAEKLGELRPNQECCVLCIILQRTLLGFSPYGECGRALS